VSNTSKLPVTSVASGGMV